jgi:hypothetical protein
VTNTDVTIEELRRVLELVSKAGRADSEDNEQLRAEIERLRTENDERARETERVLAKLKDVAIENERLRAENERLKAYEQMWHEQYASDLVQARAEVERLRAQAEILEKKNDELRTALVYWKPSQCGTIFPHPVPGEVVKYCKREHGHGGAHLIETGETWA